MTRLIQTGGCPPALSHLESPVPDCAFMSTVLKAKEQGTDGGASVECGIKPEPPGSICRQASEFAEKENLISMSAGHPAELETLFGDYPLDRAFDEMREPGGDVRPHYRALAETLARLPTMSCSGASSPRSFRF